MERFKDIGLDENKSFLPEGFLPVTDKIDTPYPFIVIGDLDEMVGRLIPGAENDQRVFDFQSKLINFQKKYAPKLSSFYFTTQKDMIKKTNKLVQSKYEELLNNGKKTGIINFDKYLLSGVEQENVLRLSLSRNPDGVLTARPGATLNKEQQVSLLDKWLRLGRFDSVILTDDVIAFADTFKQSVGLIKGILPNIQIFVVSGICSSEGEWSGKEKLESLGVNVSTVVLSRASSPIENSSSGMAIPDARDFTFLGGKITSLSNGRSLSHPYFYPFSKPLTSFYENGTEYIASKELFDLNQDLVIELENIKGSKLTIGDLENSDFGVPFPSINELKSRIEVPDSSVLVADYFSQIRSVFDC
jgi:hypothetical protein